MRFLFLAKSKADYRCYAAHARALVNLLLDMGHEVDVYDYSTGVNYNQKTLTKVDYNLSLEFRLLNHISRYFAFIRFFKLNRNAYDILQVMYLRPEYFLLANKVRLLAKKKLICIYGSDVNTYSFLKKLYQKVIREADYVSFTTTDTLNSFVKKYRYNKRENLVVNSFPVVKLGKINSDSVKHRKSFRVKYGIDSHETVVVCGMNSFPNEQINIIADKISVKTYNRVVFVFPLTYGAKPPMLKKIIQHIQKVVTSNRVIIISSYLTDDEVLDLRFSTDILVNIRKKDQAGGAFIESLAAQSYVITGSWLPYGFLMEQGIYFKTVNTPSEINDAIAEGINLREKHEVKEKLMNNTRILNSNYSLEITMNRWRTFYGSIISSLTINSGENGNR